MPEKIEVDGELVFANPYYMGDGEPLPEMPASTDRGPLGTWRNPRPMGGNVAWRIGAEVEACKGGQKVDDALEPMEAGVLA